MLSVNELNTQGKQQLINICHGIKQCFDSRISELLYRIKITYNRQNNKDITYRLFTALILDFSNLFFPVMFSTARVYQNNILWDIAWRNDLTHF
jgi:hypothetical protein